jgi:hypothetical protein
MKTTIKPRGRLGGLLAGLLVGWLAEAWLRGPMAFRIRVVPLKEESVRALEPAREAGWLAGGWLAG